MSPISSSNNVVMDRISPVSGWNLGEDEVEIFKGLGAERRGGLIWVEVMMDEAEWGNRGKAHFTTTSSPLISMIECVCYNTRKNVIVILYRNLSRLGNMYKVKIKCFCARLLSFPNQCSFFMA